MSDSHDYGNHVMRQPGGADAPISFYVLVHRVRKAHPMHQHMEEFWIYILLNLMQRKYRRHANQTHY
ncbi:hypothetical protein KSZ_73470 [Dictyobacter formicarum]|uniref:Uncharacterized protein n=1 Tax=Dictyobacter formicarum TaxID=2778368 RepID=A0ABQ3VWC6_9CHLR|nr:hypothetical protein KSZ_73470 [Dictyobacter formicarum]